MLFEQPAEDAIGLGRAYPHRSGSIPTRRASRRASPRPLQDVSSVLVADQPLELLARFAVPAGLAQQPRAASRPASAAWLDFDSGRKPRVGLESVVGLVYRPRATRPAPAPPRRRWVVRRQLQCPSERRRGFGRSCQARPAPSPVRGRLVLGVPGCSRRRAWLPIDEAPAGPWLRAARRPA